MPQNHILIVKAPTLGPIALSPRRFVADAPDSKPFGRHGLRFEGAGFRF